MPISHLEHFLVVAEDIEASRAWYVDVLGFRVGDKPDFGVPAYWLYLGERDVVHLAQAPDGDAAPPPAPAAAGAAAEIAAGGRPVHHIAFRAAGLEETMDHLDARGVPFIVQQADKQALYQLFLRDPNGVTIELNFPAEEAEGLDAPRLALRVAGRS